MLVGLVGLIQTSPRQPVPRELGPDLFGIWTPNLFQVEGHSEGAEDGFHLPPSASAKVKAWFHLGCFMWLDRVLIGPMGEDILRANQCHNLTYL